MFLSVRHFFFCECLLFRIPGVDSDLPAVSFWKIGQRHLGCIPVSVHSHIDEVFAGILFVIPGEENAGYIVAFRSVRLPGSQAMDAHGRKTDITWLQISADSRV